MLALALTGPQRVALTVVGAVCALCILAALVVGAVRIARSFAHQPFLWLSLLVIIPIVFSLFAAVMIPTLSTAIAIGGTVGVLFVVGLAAHGDGGDM